MNKFLTILTMIMVTVCPQRMAAEEWVNVSTPDGLYSALVGAGDGRSNIRLTSDIDLSTTRFLADCVSLYTFRGKINGQKSDGTCYTIKGTGEDEGSGLVYKAQNATFSHIIFENFKWSSSGEKQAVITKLSYNCKYKDITIRNCSVTNGSSLVEIGGMISISNNDSLIDCTVESSCTIKGAAYTSDANVGGLVGKAYSTVFLRCQNSATVDGENNQEGGIAAYADGCTFDRCLNTGMVYGYDNTGGIVGNAYNTIIRRCVNTGTIDCNSISDEDRRGGIVGYLHGSSASISQCLNFGNIYDCDDDCGALEGCAEDGASGAYNTHSYYYCTCNHKENQNNESEYPEDDSIYRIAKMKSGEFAYKSTVDEAGTEKWLYQDLDGKEFDTYYPVPIPSAGTLYTNVICDGTVTYTNDTTFLSTAAHTPVSDQFGYCTVCGTKIGSEYVASVIHVTTADELVKVANIVNGGTDLTNTTVYLDNDIDMDGTDFSPIGASSTNSYKGTFNGQGHRIKNLTLSSTGDGTGLFGTVQGENTVIKNIIIDPSCSVKSTSGAGIAGLVGAVSSTSGSTCNVTIENCGNEANITGVENVAGILGGVYTNNDAVVNIYNCYNTGTITGNSGKCSAAIVGYARLHTSIYNTWNSGTVSGTENNYTFAGTWETTSGRGAFDGTIDNCYTVSYKNATENSSSGVISLSEDQMRLGYLCSVLNTKCSSNADWTKWTQDIASDTIPSFGTAGLHYSRSMTNQWGTICLPFAASAGSYYDLYELTGVTDNTLTLTKATTPVAGTPYLIRRNSSVTDVDIPAASSSSVVTSPVAGSSANGLTLTGVFTSTDITDQEGYIIANNTFWNIAVIKGENKVYCAPFLAWLSGSISSGAKQLTIGFGDNTPTEVEAINALTSLKGGLEDIYDLNGRRLNNLQKGVNIVKFSNGTIKKVIK